MSTSTLSLPIGPQSKDRSIIKPTKKFKKHVLHVVGAIIMFFVTYLAMVAAAVALAIISVVLGIAGITAHASILTIILGIGLIGSGLMLIYFVIKFIFKRTSMDYSGLLEITDADSPHLFDFIRKIITETGSRMPKHVYLSANVNASVFYDSTFWSMFLPVRKNLIVGLGLVNSLNLSEFKAVLAHEFGHFSQRSMKFGSYVYNLNTIVYNMLFENESYNTVINQIAQLHHLFRFTAYINIYIVRGIQYVLRKAYIVLNKSYLGMSREMEFHADSMAAYVSGSDNAISSLRNIQAGDTCYNILLNLLNDEIKLNNKTNNLYPLHAEWLKSYTAKSDVGLISSTVSAANMPIYNYVEIEDPWSSHPSDTQREAHLKQLNVYASTSKESAWQLFNDAEEIQNQMTELLYTNANINQKLQVKEPEYFINTLVQHAPSSVFNKEYNGYYDNRPIAVFDPEKVSEYMGATYNSLQDAFSQDNCNLAKRIKALEQDINSMEAITKPENKINNFTFKSVQHTRNDAERVKVQLEKELEIAKDDLVQLDQQVFCFFYHQTDIKGKQQLTAAYNCYFEQQELTQQDLERYSNMMQHVHATTQKMPFKKIESLVDQLYQAEVSVKERLREIIILPEYAPFLTKEYRVQISKYLSQNWNYFHHKSYDMVSLNLCKSALDAYINITVERDFSAKKQLLDLQIQLISKHSDLADA